ncbi:universal stress protein [Vibrio gallicus]|uniref:universal stress protein n=1 Tax=Vibrio gallicus TaxID=190897 RepID=UPI0021C374D1|nr:universal stress protein [Vibrio gallicus]
MRYKHILVALELSKECQTLINKASLIAEQFNSKLSFVHVDGSHGEIYPELIDLQATDSEPPLKKRSVEQLSSLIKSTQYPVSHIWVGTGDLSEKVEHMVNDNHIDLIICGHHHDFWSRIVSYSKHLIDYSPADILIVPLPKGE